MGEEKIDFSKVRDFYELANRTGKKWVLDQCLNAATPEQCKYLAQYGKTPEISMMFAEKLLPIATPEQCKYLAEYGKTPEIAMMFAEKLLPNATYEQCEYLARYGKTPEIAMMFAEKLKSFDLKESYQEKFY